MWYFSGVSQGIANLGASWCYDWTSTPGAQNFTPPTGVEFVPQAWAPMWSWMTMTLPHILFMGHGGQACMHA